MTLEQAKALVPDKDYVIYENIIYGYWRWNQHRTCLEIVSQDSSRQIILAAPHECKTLGEYRGCFDSTVLPPKYFEQYSVDVIILNTDNTMCIGFYNYEDKEWHTHSLVLTELNQFCWVFKPDYLK